ncbi:heavy-metal-associated domain-containing protein, partial [Paenibacillus larvae]
MKEYRVKGLSCGNCAQMLEQRIQELEHGENATLSYNSGKLRIDPQVSLPDVKQILKSDGAYIQAESSQVQGRDESHDHSHG